MTTAFALSTHRDLAWSSATDSAAYAFAAGESAVLLDDTSAVLAFPAATATATRMHFAIRHSCGFIHAATPTSMLDRLRVPDQPILASHHSGNAFTAAVDAATGIGTGISAHDRARTVRVLADPHTAPDDLVRPGHVLPIRCADGGFSERRRVWELAGDLTARAGHPPVAVVCRLVRDDGEARTGADAVSWARAHELPLVDLRWSAR